MFVFVGDRLVDGVLPPGHERLLCLVVAVEGGRLVDDEDLGLAVPPDEQVEGLVQFVIEEFLK